MAQKSCGSRKDIFLTLLQFCTEFLQLTASAGVLVLCCVIVFLP